MNGHQRERQFVHLLREQGWWAQRAPASLGIDVIAASRSIEHEGCSELRFYEVKATSAGPFHSFGPEERRALLLQAQKAGATPLLCWWPARAKPKVYSASEWPQRKEAA